MTNKLFPGRPNYTGPKSGPFGLLHHSELWESSHDVTERVDYVQREKPEHERAIRLHNMIYLGGCSVFKTKAWADWDKARADWDKARVDWDKAWADYNKAGVDLRRAWADLDKTVVDWDKARANLDKAEANWNKVNPDANAKILTYIKERIPDCAWDGKELIFPEAGGVK